MAHRDRLTSYGDKTNRQWSSGLEPLLTAGARGHRSEFSGECYGRSGFRRQVLTKRHRTCGSPRSPTIAFPCDAVTFAMLLTRLQYLNGIGLGLPTSIQLLYASTRPRLDFVGLDLDKDGTEDKSIAFAALLAMPTLRLCTIAGTRCRVGASNASGRLTS
jgi:hypothetical protein